LTPAAVFALPDQIYMRKARTAVIALFVVAGLVGCAKPPLEAVAAAQAAVEAARSDPDVALYAPDALRSAEEQLEKLVAEKTAQERKSILTKDWDETAALAVAARDAGTEARTTAAAAKQTAGIEAAALIESAVTALAPLEIKAGQARRLRRIKLDAAAVTASLVEIRGMLDSARSDHAALAFAASRAKADAAGARIAALDAVISEAMLIARKK
jgi:hypothetical protein